jgi:outer membrane immunogenic protein
MSKTKIKILINALIASSVYHTIAVAGDVSIDSNRWNGAYLGISAGAGFGSSNTNLSAKYDSSDTSFHYRKNIDSINASGFLGGVNAGYNFSNGAMVYGVEGDVSYLGAKGRDSDLGEEYNLFQNEVATNYHWIGTVRGKVGIANGNILGYATGGLAVGSYEDFIGGVDTVYGRVKDSGGGIHTSAGYVIGAGVEYAVSARISMKAEYLFTDLGKSTLDINKASGINWWGNPGGEGYVNADHQLNIVRVGLNLKF